MRAGGLLATALTASLLLNPAAAAVAPDPTAGPVPYSELQSAPPKSAPARRPPPGRPVTKAAPVNTPPAALPQIPALIPPDPALESMDLGRMGQPNGAFFIPIIPPPATAMPPAPALAAADSMPGAPLPADSPPTPSSQLPLAHPPLAQPPLAQTPARIEPVRIEPVPAITEPTILLRTDSDTGAAAFRIGPEILVVLDAPIGFLPPGPELDPVFAKLTISRTLDATVLHIPLPAAGLRLARTARGWMITAGAPPDTIASILPRAVNNGPDAAGVQFPAAEPSRVVTILSPQTGERLLVGTQGAGGQAVPNEWQQPRFSLLPTLQGLVVAAISDDIRLRREAGGFTLATSLQADSAMAGVRPKDSAPPIAGAISRLLNIPNGSTRDLHAELNKRITAAGNAHALARSEPRLRVAEAMLALGMDVEAQAVVDVATTADPALLDQPRAIGLRAVAATLAGRLEEARALADPRLTGSVEIELWRALLQTAKDEATARDARSLADGLPLVLAYPAPLRDRLLPVTLETMALNGQAEAAQKTLQALAGDHTLDLARGMTAEAAGQPQEALKAYDEVAGRSNRLPRYKALVRSAELRIKAGQLDARAGADALEKALPGWREARQELDLRLRIADLRRQAGQWREALTVLRDGREAFPQERTQLDQKMAATFLALLNDDAVRHLAPADFVALYDQNLDLVKDIAWTEKAGSELVDRLVGLDLPGRAEPVLSRLVAKATDPVRRAVLGARLASLRLMTNEPAAAIEALATTVPPAKAAATATIDPALMQTRQLLYARAESARGNKDTALSMLDTLDTADADQLRSEIYAARKDWPHTVAALTALEHKQITSGDLTDRQQAIVMRLAVAATLSADTDTLARLAAAYGPAMARGGSASLFRLVTSAPARGTGDLPRAFEEIQLARQLEGRVGAAAPP